MRYMSCALENDDINCRLILCVVTLVDYQRPEEIGGTKKMEKQEKEFNDKRN